MKQGDLVLECIHGQVRPSKYMGWLSRVPDRKRTGGYSPLSSFTGGKRGILGRKGGLVLGSSSDMSEEEKVMDTSVVGSARHGEPNG